MLIAVPSRVPGKHLRGQDPEDMKHQLGQPMPKPRFEPKLSQVYDSHTSLSSSLLDNLMECPDNIIYTIFTVYWQ